jgi:hypothetical protein
MPTRCRGAGAAGTDGTRGPGPADPAHRACPARGGLAHRHRRLRHRPEQPGGPGTDADRPAEDRPRFCLGSGRADGSRRPVLDAIISLARDLGVRLVAEGVETQAQWDYLAQRQVARCRAISSGGQTWRWTPSAAGLKAAAWRSRRSVGRSPKYPSICRTMQGPEALLHDERLAGHLARHAFAGRSRHPRPPVSPAPVPASVLSAARRWTGWCSTPGVAGRSLRLGRRLVALGCLKHVLNEHDFLGRRVLLCRDVRHRPRRHTTGSRRLARGPAGPGGPVQTDHCRGSSCTGCLRGAIWWTGCASATRFHAQPPCSGARN